MPNKRPGPSHGLFNHKHINFFVSTHLYHFYLPFAGLLKKLELRQFPLKSSLRRLSFVTLIGY